MSQRMIRVRGFDPKAVLRKDERRSTEFRSFQRFFEDLRI